MKYILIGLFFLCALSSKSQVAIGGDGQVHSAATGGTVTNSNELKIATDTTSFKSGIAVINKIVYVYYGGKWNVSSGGVDSTVSNLVNYYNKTQTKSVISDSLTHYQKLQDGLIHIDSVKATGALQVTAYATSPSPTTWRITAVSGQNIYSKSSNTVFTITAATTGYLRTDIIVADTLNTLSVIQGMQALSNPITPSVPAYKILVTTINISGSNYTVAAPNLSSFVTLNTYQVVTGRKDMDSVGINQLLIYDAPVGGYGKLSIADDVFTVEKANGVKVFSIENGSFGFSSTANKQLTINANLLSANREHYAPNKNGTIALLSDISDSSYTKRQIDSINALNLKQLDTTNRNTGVKTIFQAAKDSLTLRGLINTNTTNIATNTAAITAKLDTGGTYLKTVTLTNTGILHNTPTYSYNSATHNYSITQTLASQSAHSILGTVTAGSPTFIQSIDSTYIPGFHTTSYYDNRYALAASLSNYLPLTGGSVSGSITAFNYHIPSAGGIYSNSANIGLGGAIQIFGPSNGDRVSIRAGGAEIALINSSGVTASSFIKSGGTASQFQMGDGTVATVDGTSITNIAGVLSAVGGSSTAKLDTSGNYINTIAINADALYGAATYAKTFHTGTITQNLNNQSAYQIFGTGSSTASPAFRYIDSNYFGGTFKSQVNATANKVDSARFKNDSIAKNTAINNLVQYNGISLTSTWNGEGHSIAAGSSATSTANRFYNLLAAATSTTVNNTAVGGSTVRNVIYRRFNNAETYNTTQSLAIYNGINDIGNSISPTSPYSIYKGLQTVIANQYLDTVFRVDASPVTTSGTWAALTTTNISSKSSIKGFGSPIYSSTAGSTLSFPFIGNNLVIGYWGVDVSHTGFGRFSITVDGTNYGVYDTKGGAIDYYYASIGTFDFRMPNVAVVKIPDGKHSIVITVLDNLEVDFDYIGRMGQPQFQKGVIVGKLGYCLQAGYNLYPAGYIRNNKVDSANSYIDSLKNTFNSLGYPLVIVNPNSYVDTTTAFAGSDGLHPSNGGHYSIYQSFFQGIKQTGSSGTSGSFVNNSTSSQTGNFNITGVGKQNGGLVVGNELGGYVTSGLHKAQINANYNQTGLFISGGNGLEIFDSTSLNSAFRATFGHSDTTIHFQSYTTGDTYRDFFKINTITRNVIFPAPVIANSLLSNAGITSSGQNLINTANTDYTNTSGSGASFLINNSSASGQSVIMNIINGATRSKWRTDVAGNINWVSYNSGNHFFFNGGDYGTGSVSAVIGRNGTNGWLQVGYNNASPTFSYNLDVNGTAYVNGTFLTKKVTVTTGTNASAGTATLSSGTVTVSTTAVTASSLIFVQYQGAASTTTSILTVPTITAGTSFVITALTAGGTATATTDNNLVKWWIIN